MDLRKHDRSGQNDEEQWNLRGYDESMKSIQEREWLYRLKLELISSPKEGQDLQGPACYSPDNRWLLKDVKRDFKPWKVVSLRESSVGSSRCKRSSR